MTLDHIWYELSEADPETYYSRGQEHTPYKDVMNKSWLAVSCSQVACLPPQQTFESKNKKTPLPLYILFALEKLPVKSHPQML